MKRLNILGLSGVLLACGCGDNRKSPVSPEPPQGPSTPTGETPTPTPTPSGDPGAQKPERQAFAIEQGDTWNRFVREGEVSAHVLTTSGKQARIIAAFPAANSGIGIWFDKSNPVDVNVVGNIEPVVRPKGMRGVQVRVGFGSAKVRAPGIVLTNIRFLRDFVKDPKLVPKDIVNQVSAGPPLVISRTTLDGGAHFELVVEPGAGTKAQMGPDGALLLDAGSANAEATFTFLQDNPPLTPIGISELLKDGVVGTETDTNALAFLSFREKIAAGSWRYLTYFGRDTLLSVRMLMPALKSPAIEGALRSVIEGVNDGGEVAHEEDLGEFAAVRHKQEGRPVTSDPIFDYKMVDDDYMLAPVLASYVLDTEEGRNRARAFLSAQTSKKVAYARILESNLDFVLTSAAPFSKSPKAKNLIAIRHEKVGDWRDSLDGLAHGKYAFSVNVGLVPAALEATARLYESGLLCNQGDAACEARSKERAAAARGMHDVWKNVGRLFDVKIPKAKAQSLIRSYAKEQGVDPTSALAEVPPSIVFPALSLSKAGKPIPVQHSDDSFVLLFRAPEPSELDNIASRLIAPFPAGLTTPVGVVIANPAYIADRKLRAMFGRDRYHGAVMWSWQQAMLAAGLARQLERTDLPEATRAALIKAEDKVWGAIEASNAARSSEHWTWAVENGQWKLVRFGADVEHESNAIQLWSTVYLAVRRPTR